MSDQDQVSWLNSMRRIYENFSETEELKEDSLEYIFLHLIKEEVRRCEIYNESYLEVSIKSSNFVILEKFVRASWPPAERGIFYGWSMCTGPTRNYFFSYLKLDGKDILIKIGLDGSLLIEGNIDRRLPESIFSHKDYRRIFDDII